MTRAQFRTSVKKTFNPSSTAYLISSTIMIVFVLVTVFFVRSLVKSDIPLVESNSNGIFLFIVLVLFIAYILAAFELNAFKTDDKYLYVYKPMLLFHLYEKWDNIESIIIERDLTVETGETETLMIKTYRKKIVKFSYQLIEETHQEFIKHLKTKGVEVSFRVKNFSPGI